MRSRRCGCLLYTSETIKASGAEHGFFERWTGYQASVNTQAIRFAKIDQYMGLIPAFISALSNTLIMALGVLLTMHGAFPIGMVMAFQGFLSAFNAPASALIESGQRLQEMRSEMERVEDVMDYPCLLYTSCPYVSFRRMYAEKIAVPQKGHR